MHRQTLATREKVLGLEHSETLTSVNYLADLLASRYGYDESTALYERACAGYNATLGKDHPTTRACRQHYSQMLSTQEQDPLNVPPDTLRSGVSRQTSKGSRLSRGLGKMGLNTSKGL